MSRKQYNPGIKAFWVVEQDDPAIPSLWCEAADIKSAKTVYRQAVRGLARGTELFVSGPLLTLADGTAYWSRETRKRSRQYIFNRYDE
jgi:hypothetical protein